MLRVLRLQLWWKGLKSPTIKCNLKKKLGNLGSVNWYFGYGFPLAGYGLGHVSAHQTCVQIMEDLVRGRPTVGGVEDLWATEELPDGRYEEWRLWTEGPPDGTYEEGTERLPDGEVSRAMILNRRTTGRGGMKGVDLERKDHRTWSYEGCRFGTEGPLDGRWEEWRFGTEGPLDGRCEEWRFGTEGPPDGSVLKAESFGTRLLDPLSP